MFSKSTLNQLDQMSIDGIEYYQYLLDKFGADIKFFDEVISKFYSAAPENKSLFCEYCDAHSIDRGSELGDYLCEMFNNLCRYNQGGVFELFKRKQAEWGAPRVNLRPEDAPNNSDIEMLADEIIIYRGMSKDEYDNKSFTQHWTTDINEAIKFATTIYSDLPIGVVVKAKINKQDVIYYDNNDSEKEVIPSLEKIREIELIDFNK
jgi:hypothetical protein